MQVQTEIGVHSSALFYVYTRMSSCIVQ